MKTVYYLKDLQNGIEDKNAVKKIYINDKNLSQQEFEDLNLEQYKNLQYLYCSNNQIEQLGYYQKLKILFCEHNQIKKIPKYPKLNSLISEGNPLGN